MSDQLIKVADSTLKLDKLHAYIDKTNDHKSLEEEFARVCKALFGVTLDDLSDENILRLLSESVKYPQEKALLFAAEKGFDLTFNKRPLHDWKSFVILLLAKELSVIPSDEELRALKLEREKIRYLTEKAAASRTKGYIKTAKAHKDYGFIRVWGTTTDVFVHKSEVTKAGLPFDTCVELTFEATVDKQGRSKAVNLQKIADAYPRRKVIDSNYGSTPTDYTKWLLAA